VEPGIAVWYTTGKPLRSLKAGQSKMDKQALRVMVVDDSNTIRQSISGVLEEAGYDVMCCTDGFNCIANTITFNPDLFLIDLLMPRLNGYQTASLIRNKDKFKETPIIMLSSKDGLFDKARGHAAGASDYLTKPYTKDEILAAIRKYYP
jgi:twitching motility two-component system response regulator PilG